MLAIAAAGLGAIALAPASAQQVEIKAAPPPREETPPAIIPPGLHYETTRPSDADHYPQGTRVEHDPAFIGPLSGERRSTTERGRAGLSGWTAPNTPVGAAVTGHREVTGWFALGFTITWDGPSPPAKRSAR